MILAKISLHHVSSAYPHCVLSVSRLSSFSLLSYHTIVSLGNVFSLISSQRDMSVFRDNKIDVIWGQLDRHDYVV